MNKLILLFFFITSTFFSQNKPVGILQGKIIDRNTKQPLIGANVFLLKTNKGASSNKKGEYRINNLPVGTYSVQITYIGYKKIVKTDIIVKPQRTTYLNVELESSTVEMENVIVSAGYFQEVSSKPISAINFSAEEVRRAPGSAGDVSRILFGLPSLAKINDSRNSLIVRGGSPIENTFYIDNIEIPNINHFPVEGSSDGPIGILNVDFIEDVNFYSGNFSPIYGDRLSSIMEITYREGAKDKFRPQVNLSMQGFGAAIEGPLGNKGSYLFSGNMSYLDLILNEDETGGAIPRYGDMQGKINYNINENNKLTLLNIFSIDHIDLTYENAIKTDLTNLYGKTDGITNVIGLNWQYIWGKNGYSNTSISNTLINYDRDYKETKSRNDLFKNITNENLIKLRNVNYYRQSNSSIMEFGIEAKYNISKFNVIYEQWEDRYGNPTPRLEIKNNLSTIKLGAFINHNLNITDRFKIEYGIRLDYFEYTDQINSSPRVTFSYNFDNGYTLTSAVGLFYQDIPEIILLQNDSFKNLSTPRAIHSGISVSKILGNSTKLTIEAYYKNYDNIPSDPTQPYLFIFDQAMMDGVFLNHENLINKGEAFSRGIEIMLQKKLAENFYGLISGSYSKTKYKALDGKWYNRIYDNEINFNIEGGFIPNNEWEFKVRWIYAGGAPYTPFDLVESTKYNKGIWDTEKINAKRLPDYHSLNIRIDKRFYFNNSNLILYLSVWNAYGRENIAFYEWNQTKNKLDKQKQWSTLPVIGIEYEF